LTGFRGTQSESRDEMAADVDQDLDRHLL
jgi:hypothetical protein